MRIKDVINILGFGQKKRCRIVLKNGAVYEGLCVNYENWEPWTEVKLIGFPELKLSYYTEPNEVVLVPKQIKSIEVLKKK